MIKVYRKISGVETEVCTISDRNGTEKSAIMGAYEVAISVIVDEILDIQEGDYIRLNGINYTLNRDAEYTIESQVKYSYDLVFEHPFYVLLNKLYCNRITGHTSFTLTGKLRDFVELLVWCVNISAENPDGVDTGWTIGDIIDTDYMNLQFTDLFCNEILNMLADKFQVEYFFNNKQINFVERIERLTDHVFEQGAGKGLYKLTQQNVDKEDTVTRLLVRGGNQNVPIAYADEEGYLKLPENYLENFSEHSKVVEKKKKFEEEFPKFVGTVATVSGENNKILTCPQIDFDVVAIAVGDNARINFLTGDLMGGPGYKFKWNNANKQITLIEQDDETALSNPDGSKPKIPNSTKKAKVGDTFNFTGVLMAESYVTASINRLRAKGTKYLNLYSKKRVKFTLDIDHRYLRNKPALKVGDLVVISIPQKSFSQVIRITQLERNLHTGAISVTVSNYLEENWEKYVSNKVEEVRNEILARQANVRNTLEAIFKDGIITESELKIIESVLDRLYIERGQMNAQYLVVRGNINLVNKVPLTNAWDAYQASYINVRDAINSAIADGEITEAEKIDIDNKISAYSTQLNGFSSALEQAREDIENYKNQAILDVTQDNINYLQQQIDGEVSNWFYPYSPTLSNYPASDWTTNAEKDRHIGDTFTNTQPSPAADAGKSWRFVKNGTIYSWTQIADSDAVKALQQAAQAQATADGKSTTFLVQPSNYHLGDTWVLNADSTINGTAYKQGEILTATQDSTSFVEAHWIKRVRYTDDTAVDNLQIGGVNLIRGTNTFSGYNSYSGATIVRTPNYPVPEWNATDATRFQVSGGSNIVKMLKNLFLASERPNNITYTLSIHVKNLGNTDVIVHSNHASLVETVTPGQAVRLVFTPWRSSTATMQFQFQGVDASTGFDIALWHDQVEEGNKVSAWSENPDDTKAGINNAQVAAGNAQSTANSLKDFTDTAFKDGIINRGERVSIEKYLNTINETKLTVDSSYSQVYNNSYLTGTPKTNLLNAKNALDTAYTNLINAINSAIADDTATPAEKALVDNRYGLFNTALAAYQVRLEEANNSIGKGRIDELEYVNRNLVGEFCLKGWAQVSGRMVVSSVGLSYFVRLEAGKDYYLHRANTNNNSRFVVHFYTIPVSNDDEVLGVAPTRTIDSTAGTDVKFKAASNETCIVIYLSNQKSSDNIPAAKIKLEKGITKTPYILAVEDEPILLARANTSAAITDKFATTINGGLVSAVMLVLRALNSQKVTAGISGIQGDGEDNPSFWSGGTYDEALALIAFLLKLTNGQKPTKGEYDELASIVMLHSGAAKIGDFIVQESGQIVMLDRNTGDTRIIFSINNIPPASELISQTSDSDSTSIGSGSTSTSLMLTGSVQVRKKGATATFNGVAITVTGTGSARSNGMVSTITVRLFALRNGVRYLNLAETYLHFDNTVNEYKSATSVRPPLSFPIGDGIGTYTFELVVERAGNIFDAFGSTTASAFSWKYNLQGVRRFEFGINGFMSWFTDNAIHFDEANGLLVKGATDIPAGLGGGSISSGSSSGTNIWGKVTSASKPSNITTINHSIGDSKYTVIVTLIGSSTTWYIQSKGTNSVQIVCSGSFDFILVRTPY